jgi:hypothetical protein
MTEDPSAAGDPAEIPANLFDMGDGMIRFTAGGLDPDMPGLHAQHIHRFPDGGRIEIDYYRDEGPYTDNATWYVASASGARYRLDGAVVAMLRDCIGTLKPQPKD